MKRRLALVTLILVALGPLSASSALAAEQVSEQTHRAGIEPLPGQSDQAAPESREKRVVENVHTDTVSSFVDDGEFVLDSKADIDGELGKRFAADATLFYLSDVGSSEVPNNPMFSFLGAPGSPIWLAPQTQNHAIIWPGFSTEHPSLRAVAEGEIFDVRMLQVDGPGEVEIYFIGDDGPDRVFSSTIDLPDWQISVPQHTHMNWAFTAPGTYTITFEQEGQIGGVRQTARNDYTFVVGDLAAHTRDTSTTIEADRAEIDPGDPVTLTAAVTPATVGPEAVGAVQFRDLTTGATLGHAPVGERGIAAFRTGALQPGEHRIVAEFVPTWSTDFATSASTELSVSVSGTQILRPEHIDTVAVTEAELAETPAGAIVRVTTPSAQLRAGSTLTAHIDAEELHGDWVSVWRHDHPAWVGWAQLDLAGNFTVTIAQPIAAGDYRLVVKNRDGEFIGWAPFSVLPEPSVETSPVPPPATRPPAAPAPTAPPQECRPAVTLDHGHIDAFTVSAGGGLAVLQILEDVTGSRVLREVETVLLHVKESAFAQIPGLPGGPSGYVLPLNQDQGLIWPGWDTNRTAASGYSDVSITITEVAGPGQVSLYTSQGAFGGWRPILTHGGYALPGTIHEPHPAHTHAQWVFGQKGVYVLTAYAVATSPRTGASLTTASHDYVIQVGDVPLGDVFCGVTAHSASASDLVGAAVYRAGAEAVAAAQAEATEKENAEKERAEKERAERARAARAAAAAARDTQVPVSGVPGSQLHPALMVGIIGGGALAVAGIIGATFWVVRRGPVEPGG